MKLMSPMLTSFALVLVIVIDQFRTDELLRAQKIMGPAGIGMLAHDGIFYDDAHHSQFFNMTCPGHVAISTGAPSGLTGIMLNDDWDAENQTRTYCVADSSQKWLGADADTKEGNYGSSGLRILTTTVGDELKTLWKDQSRVVSVSLKDRAAIGMAGHLADGVYWFAPKSRMWTTSTYYNRDKALPPWVQKFNVIIQNRKDTAALDYGLKNAAIEDETDFVLAAAEAENLGHHPKPDLLWVSYSTHDFVGHQKGDDSKELKETIVAEDGNIARLIKKLQKQVGGKKILVVLTADHGAGFDTGSELKIPGGKLSDTKFKETINDCLNKANIKSVHGSAIAFLSSMNVFLSNDIIDKKTARIKTKECLMAQNRSVWGAYTRDEILAGQIPKTPWLRNLSSAFNPERGPDVVGILKPYWNSSDLNMISHETSYDYDSWVPLIFWYKGIKAHQIHRRVDILSVAPTLSRMFETRRPSGAGADFLSEVLDDLPQLK